MWGLSLVAASGGHSSSRCTGLLLSQPLLLRSTGSRRAGSAIVAHGPSRSAACGIFPDQGSNPCPLHWQADSQPLRLGSPTTLFLLLCYLGVCGHWSPLNSVCLSLPRRTQWTLPLGSFCWNSVYHVKRVFVQNSVKRKGVELQDERTDIILITIFEPLNPVGLHRSNVSLFV